MIERLQTTLIPTQHRSSNNEGVSGNLEQEVVERKIQPDEQNMLDKFAEKKENVQEVVKGLNEFLNPTHTSLKFEFHDKLNEYYVTVIDDVTKEIVKEIPAKKMLDTYAAMKEYLGILVDKKI